MDYLDGGGADGVDLILTDINMPGMSGLELLEIITTTYSKIEVFVVSAYDTPVYRKKGLALGATKFIAKPVDFDELEKELQRRV